MRELELTGTAAGLILIAIVFGGSRHNKAGCAYVSIRSPTLVDLKSYISVRLYLSIMMMPQPPG